MADYLCEDIRRDILDRAAAAEDMCLAVMSGTRIEFRLIFYVSRNMRDPPHHVRLTRIDKEGNAHTYLLRNPEALEMMLQPCWKQHCFSSRFNVHYIQGADKPPMDTYPNHWLMASRNTDPNVLSYTNQIVQSFVFDEITQNDPSDYIKRVLFVNRRKEEWNGSTIQGIVQCIHALVSTN